MNNAAEPLGHVHRRHRRRDAAGGVPARLGHRRRRVLRDRPGHHELPLDRLTGGLRDLRDRGQRHHGQRHPGIAHGDRHGHRLDGEKSWPRRRAHRPGAPVHRRGGLHRPERGLERDPDAHRGLRRGHRVGRQLPSPAAVRHAAGVGELHLGQRGLRPVPGRERQPRGGRPQRGGSHLRGQRLHPGRRLRDRGLDHRRQPHHHPDRRRREPAPGRPRRRRGGRRERPPQRDHHRGLQRHRRVARDRRGARDRGTSPPSGSSRTPTCPPTFSCRT